MRNKKISASLEDYLEVIFNIYEEKKAVRAVEISRRLGVGKSSVTEALRNLSNKGLVNYAPYDIITLTKDGESLGREIVEKHEILTFFFNEILKIELEEARENACRVEHTISQGVHDNLVKFIKKYNELSEEDKKKLLI